MYQSKFLYLLSSILLSSLCACQSLNTDKAAVANPEQTASSLQAAWLQYGEQGQLSLRAITTAEFCPAYQADAQTMAMHVRAGAETMPLRPTVSKPELSKASAFPVLSCEAALPANVRQVQLGQLSWQVPQRVEKILVIGDTGCRTQASSNYYQACNDSQQWAFASMVAEAVKHKPDLIIHVGDYHYRENACPASEPACQGTPWGYGWDTWQADFFAPAKPLLQAAPWVFVRGNHETCQRGGQGWWRFLDPRPLIAGRDCRDAKDDLVGDYSPPYAVPFVNQAGQRQQIIVFDSAKVGYKVLSKQDIAWQTYQQQMQLVDQLSQQASFNFFINHHPILGLASERNKEGKLKIYPGNEVLQDVMHSLHAERLFPKSVQMTLAGHVHIFEALSFSSDHPAQLVSGNGGSSLDLPLPMPLPESTTVYPAAKIEQFINSNAVGFLIMQAKGNEWQIQAWDKDGHNYANCLSDKQKLRC